MKKLFSIMLLVLMSFVPALAQSTDAPKPKVEKTHNFFLNKLNTPLLFAEAGAHIYAGRLHNDVVNDELMITFNKYPQRPEFYGEHNRYSYYKEFGTMGAAVGLAYLAHKTNHHKIERFILGTDAGTAFYFGYRYDARYKDIDCEYNSFCK